MPAKIPHHRLLPLALSLLILLIGLTAVITLTKISQDTRRQASTSLTGPVKLIFSPPQQNQDSTQTVDISVNTHSQIISGVQFSITLTDQSTSSVTFQPTSIPNLNLLANQLTQSGSDTQLTVAFISNLSLDSTGFSSGEDTIKLGSITFPSPPGSQTTIDIIPQETKAEDSTTHENLIGVINLPMSVTVGSPYPDHCVLNSSGQPICPMASPPTCTGDQVLTSSTNDCGCESYFCTSTTPSPTPTPAPPTPTSSPIPTPTPIVTPPPATPFPTLVPTPFPSPSASSIPTPLPACFSGDLNKDGTVNTLDRQILLDNFFLLTPNLTGDLNSDSIVDVLDYSLLIQQWGQNNLCN